MTLQLVHTWDEVTSFCRRCGCSRIQWVEAGNGCTSADNVVGVSHVLAHRRMSALVAEVERVMIGLSLPPSSRMGGAPPAANWPGLDPEGPAAA